MPTSKPFYMYRYKHGCQTVAGMKVQDQALTFYFPLYPASGGYYTPYMQTSVLDAVRGTRKYDLHLCYYTVIT